jgi:hypothetical protein
LVRELIERTGQQWVLEWTDQSTDAAKCEFLARRFTSAAEACGRLGGTPFDDARLDRESRDNPHKVAAFLQAARRIVTPEILAAVWLILDGESVERIHVSYQREARFELRLEFEPLGGRPRVCASNDVFDAAFLMHLGVAKIDDDKPWFNGFYAIRRCP